MSKWEMVRLGDVCTINPPKKLTQDLYMELNEVSFIPMSDVTEDGRINTSNKRNYSDVSNGFSYFIEDDVLFAKITPCMENGKGTIARGLINGLGVGSTEFHVLRPNKNLVTSDWVYRFLSYSGFRKIAERNMTGSAGQKRVPKAFLESTLVPLPPLETQKQITRTLDTVAGLLAMSKQQLVELDNLIKSTFYEMFGDPVRNEKGWKIKKLIELCENLDSKRVPITSKDREKGIYPYYGASGIVDYVKNFIFDGSYLLVSEDGANLLARVTPIAFSVSGKCWVNNHAHVLKFDDYYIQLYIEYFINNIDISRYVTGSAQPKLNQAKLNDIDIPYPPVELLIKFANIVTKIEEQKSLVKKAIDETQYLFDSLMSRYFD
ncbi:restriction endonuclease subunit S [Ammoniphilus resinae]|uniref:Type I restriction enzyme S subunit n=1 Tax=Ammoniphilus resinae TaxID=861532 RepID=A0ABS4GXC7_9BACL|nr:type I restriction enzyme S subunit [Ammoniphilus resinae]